MNEFMTGLTTILYCGLGLAGGYGLIESFRQTAEERELERKREAAARELASSMRFQCPDVTFSAPPPDAILIERGRFIENERWTR